MEDNSAGIKMFQENQSSNFFTASFFISPRSSCVYYEKRPCLKSPCVTFTLQPGLSVSIIFLHRVFGFLFSTLYLTNLCSGKAVSSSCLVFPFFHAVIDITACSHTDLKAQSWSGRSNVSRPPPSFLCFSLFGKQGPGETLVSDGENVTYSVHRLSRKTM